MAFGVMGGNFPLLFEEEYLSSIQKKNRYGRDVAQPGRAQRSGRWGRWFKSSRPDHLLFFLFNNERELVRTLIPFCAGWGTCGVPFSVFGPGRRFLARNEDLPVSHSFVFHFPAHTHKPLGSHSK
jgi:hypothetical protein